MYGFSFKKENAGGLGAALHAIMLALHYARKNGHQFAFVKEGFTFPRLNGSIDDLDLPDKTFHSYFSSFQQLVKEDETIAIWKSCPNGFDTTPPDDDDDQGKRISWYSKLMQEIFHLHDDIHIEIEERVQKSGFNPITDVVLHIRRTDKIFKFEGSVVESSELPVSEYASRTIELIEKKFPDQKNVRVFLCSDDKSIITQLSDSFGEYGITLVYDKSEPPEPIQAMRIGGKLTKSAAWEENLVALTNLTIMSRGLHLVGGRMSYFFRIAELLRYPSPALNVKDLEKFGTAPYAELDEMFVNPMWERRYHDFVSPIYKVDQQCLQNLTDLLEKDYIITVPNFMSEKAAENVLTDMKKFKKEWWSHAVLPSSDDGWKVSYILDKDHVKLKNAVKIAEKAADNGNFAYHFKRTVGDHYTTCKCYVCRLKATMTSYEVLKALSNIVGKRVVGMLETFASKYERDDFLTMHHDKSKGDYTFILGLSEDWNPVHGGITNFWDSTNQSIFKSLSPKFNTLTIFKLSPEKQMDHFVSRVSGNGARYAYTGWFKVEQEQ